MLFNSLTFLIFFALVFLVHALVPGWRGKKAVLLLASYVFYAAWHAPFAFILLVSTLLDWYLARRIFLSASEPARRLLLQVSLLVNLGLLAVFKYADFLLLTMRDVAAGFGISYAPPALGLMLPIGISFYTFASLSYTIDVYRREVRGDTSLLDYALFVSFFPHLVAGPIVRARYLLPQFATPRRATRMQIAWGLVLLVFGVFCKSVLADSMLAPVADAFYAEPLGYGMLDAWAGVLAFSGQIFYDFAGYSLCAIGIALCFGFAFPDNFHFPYAAAGFSDFWRRWHISLSSWLRDYLYVPLGGNRGGRLLTCRNLMLTMLIGGLWHGASWMFVMWGGLHGVWLVIERFCQRQGAGGQRSSLFHILFTFIVVTLTWIPFRASSLRGVTDVVRALIWPHPGYLADEAARNVCLLVMAVTLAWQYRLRDSSLEAVFSRWGFMQQALVLVAALLAIFLCSGGDEHAFIYFQF